MTIKKENFNKIEALTQDLENLYFDLEEISDEENNSEWLADCTVELDKVIINLKTLISFNNKEK